MNSSIADELEKAVSHLKLLKKEPLAPYTTVKIGGPAEFFVQPETVTDLTQVASAALKLGMPITLLGWGANSLISDDGISGLVIHPKGQEISILDTPQDELARLEETLISTQPRWQKGSKDSAYGDFSALNYHESADRVHVRLGAGTGLPSAINGLLNQGVTGLQWFSKIPASIGGAIYNNIHGGTYFLGDFITAVTVLTPSGAIQHIPASELAFAYDYSRFHHTDEIIISADLLLYRGDVERARNTVAAWAKQKASQPAKSLGCIFQNITEHEQVRLNLPTPSVGYLIDQVLHLKGFQIGDAQVSHKHAAFIENIGHSTARDYLEVITTIVQRADSELSLTLKPEIFFLGFTPTELSGLSA